ncbi:hypothetical protein PQX77_002174 [Marasmius sp. AFHP31]|nr:hypothetical protein PQX77_002174 [Marasmius sp. AFHP31]
MTAATLGILADPTLAATCPMTATAIVPVMAASLASIVSPKAFTAPRTSTNPALVVHPNIILMDSQLIEERHGLLLLPSPGTLRQSWELMLWSVIVILLDATSTPKGKGPQKRFISPTAGDNTFEEEDTIDRELRELEANPISEDNNNAMPTLRPSKMLRPAYLTLPPSTTFSDPGFSSSDEDRSAPAKPNAQGKSKANANAKTKANANSRPPRSTPSWTSAPRHLHCSAC